MLWKPIINVICHHLMLAWWFQGIQSKSNTEKQQELEQKPTDSVLNSSASSNRTTLTTMAHSKTQKCTLHAEYTRQQTHTYAR